MKNLRFLILLLVGFTRSHIVDGQNCTITGKLIDVTGSPIKNAEIVIKSLNTKAKTEVDGNFTLEFPCRKITLQISQPFFEKKEIKIDEISEKMELGNIILKDKELDSVDVIGENNGLTPRMPKIEAGLFTTINNNVEDRIKTWGLGVRSNNEMSASYNVRGGSFDENLIYVNDVEIYRPLLVRAGQQEGLSFINSDLVDNIYFSSGGYEARYDDKISSVLDVKYRKPTELKGSVSGGLLGAQVSLEDISKNHRFTWMMGARYQNNSYVLSTLDTKGDYKPKFTDFQTLLTFAITDKLEVSWLNYFSNNIYNVVPQNRETDFGTVSAALRLTVYYDGQEVTQFKTFAQALTFKYEINRKSDIRWISSWFNNDEQENYDILGAYRLGDIDQDPGSQTFGQVNFVRGVGGYLEHARNRLKSTIINTKLLYTHKNKHSQFNAGIKLQRNEFTDKMSEWNMIDSAGFSTPQTPGDSIILNYTLKAKGRVLDYLTAGFIQNNWKWQNTKSITKNDSSFNSVSVIELCAGVRTNYLSLNDEFTVGPRLALLYTPSWYRRKKGLTYRRNMIFHLAGGVYYQPPMYRELRGFNGNLNTDLKAQRSIHIIGGNDWYFTMWGRSFKYTIEAYYKYLTNVVPYEVDNVRLRYYGTNNAKGYATGVDMKINGQFIRGIESWATLSILSTKENLIDDKYTVNYNSDGQKIIPGYTVNDSVVSSKIISPGYIPRPTDQILSFSLFFQDQMPKLEQFKVNVNLLFASGVPFGPPDQVRYKDTLRGPFYRRVDIGFIYELWANKEKLRPGSFGTKIDKAYISLQVFNLLGVSNTISFNWIQDSSGLRFAVPNYLTGRRFNLKFILKF